MSQTSCLKVIAVYMVHESLLSKYAKIQMLRFIENEASDLQLHAFIAEGKIRRTEDIDEAIIKYLPPVMIVRAAITAGKLAYNRFFGPAARACASRKGDDKKLCIKNYRLKANYAKLAALKRESRNCSQTNDAAKCRQLFVDAAKKVEEQIKKDRA